MKRILLCLTMLALFSQASAFFVEVEWTPLPQEGFDYPIEDGLQYLFNQNEVLYVKAALDGSELSEMFLTDFDKGLLYPITKPVASNIQPMFIAHETKLVSINSTYNELNDFALLIQAADGTQRDIDLESGEATKFIAEAGEVFWLLLDVDRYGRSEAVFDFNGVKQIKVNYYTVPKDTEIIFDNLEAKENCEKWMSKEETLFWCGFEHEFCASTAKEMGCTTDELISCNEQACYQRLIREGIETEASLLEKLAISDSHAAPEVALEVEELTGAVEQLSEDVNKSKEEQVDLINAWGATNIGIVGIIIAIIVAIVLVTRRLNKKKGEGKDGYRYSDFGNNFDEETKQEVVENGIREREQDGEEISTSARAETPDSGGSESAGEQGRPAGGRPVGTDKPKPAITFFRKRRG